MFSSSKAARFRLFANRILTIELQMRHLARRRKTPADVAIGGI
jgi:hypothetical protein